jgi:signal transduction histidine kinase
MTSINTAALINLLGFTTGAVLYAMLLAMVLRHPALTPGAAEPVPRGSRFGVSANGLLLATAILGLLWNAGALATYGVRDFGVAEPFPVIVALSFAALGFLPAVVVHAALRRRAASAEPTGARWIKLAAYGLSTAAGVMHFYAALVARVGPSNAALRALTVGYVALIVALFAATRRQPGWERAVWASALAVFAVSALHLSRHNYGGPEAWSFELLGHHASLPLALAILYEDYRFAFADIFLKRALALVLLVALSLSLYVFVASPLLAANGARGPVDPRAVSVLLGLWVITALLYPSLRRAAVWFVDAVVLRRADYGELRASLSRRLGEVESPDEVLAEVSQSLAPALTTREVLWVRTDGQDAEGDPELSSAQLPEKTGTHSPASRAKETVRLAAELTSRSVAAAHEEGSVVLLDRMPGASAVVFVPTAEPPYFALVVGELVGGRRLLSDDIGMLEAVAVAAARRIDALRVTHERCEQVSREQEISKLATEAQLRALRAQVNPHFLFNALTTVGYLIKTSPERALDTLLKLTDLLRRVLRSTGEFVTLGEELKLVESYLDIERERFEERLRVRLDVPPDLLGVRLPSLLVQPLVENAIKHGIAPSRHGGEVCVSARLEPPAGRVDDGVELLCIVVRDTGVGASEIELARGRRRGVGLSNIEERLRCHCGPAASLKVESTPGAGATVELRVPVQLADAARSGTSRPSGARERKGA